MKLAGYKDEGAVSAYLWEVSLAVADEQAGLAAASIAYNNNLLGIGGRLGYMGGSRFTARC